MNYLLMKQGLYVSSASFMIEINRGRSAHAPVTDRQYHHKIQEAGRQEGRPRILIASKKQYERKFYMQC